jgi:fucose 4-O-acetylase-like acetyltransferase
MKVVAQSFSWPFRGQWKSRWIVGLVSVLLLPIAFIPLLGYAVAATREAELDTANGPPIWKLSGRLLSEGFWISVVVVLLTAPFALLLNPLAGWLFDAHVLRGSDASVSQLYAHTIALFLLALPWGLLLLIHMPHATARFAFSGNAFDVFDLPASIRAVRHDFTTWNLAAAAIVTGWAIGLACVGLLCAGVVPGVFYAILVSAHASAALHHKDTDLPTR